MPAKNTTIAIAIAIAGAALAGAGLTAAITALAAIGGARAPCARAAAIVNADGSVLRSTGIVAVRRVSEGNYCIDLDDDINAAKAVPVATPRAGAPWDTIVLVEDSTMCGDTTKSFRVATGKTSGGFRNAQFHVVVD